MSTWRGHVIEEVEPGVWAYADTRQPVANQPARPCGHCGLTNTPEGHDGCLGTIPGALNACCGHGEPRMAYVQWQDGSETRGSGELPALLVEALAMIIARFATKGARGE